jgi:hypothetical protein
MLAEVRAYGEGLIIAEQIPSKLTPDVIKNTAVKIVHRLPAKDDRDSVGATMNVTDEQSRYVVTLVPGEGAVFTDGMDRPLLVRVPNGADVEDNQPGRLAKVDRLIRRRSNTCGTDCLARACTLRELRESAHVLAEEPWLVVWAELSVVAHLTGKSMPVPAAAVREAFVDRGLSSRAVDCALSHAVDEAVAVRSSSLPPSVSPAALAGHVRDAMARVLAGSPPCDAAELDYLATPFRWELVRRALEAVGDGPRDPRTPSWEARLRRKIPGATAGEQLLTVHGWLVRDLNDQPAVDAVNYGARRPSALESVIGVGPADRLDRLRAALEQFSECAWALAFYRPRPVSS